MSNASQRAANELRTKAVSQVQREERAAQAADVPEEAVAAEGRVQIRGGFRHLPLRRGEGAVLQRGLWWREGLLGPARPDLC